MRKLDCPAQVTTPERGQKLVAAKDHHFVFDFVTGLAESVTGDAFSAIALADHLLAVVR